MENGPTASRRLGKETRRCVLIPIAYRTRTSFLTSQDPEPRCQLLAPPAVEVCKCAIPPRDTVRLSLVIHRYQQVFTVGLRETGLEVTDDRAELA